MYKRQAYESLEKTEGVEDLGRFFVGLGYRQKDYIDLFNVTTKIELLEYSYKR